MNAIDVGVFLGRCLAKLSLEYVFRIAFQLSSFYFFRQNIKGADLHLVGVGLGAHLMVSQPERNHLFVLLIFSGKSFKNIHRVPSQF